MGVSEKMTSSVLGSCAHSARNCARYTNIELCRASLLACSACKAPCCARFTSNFVHCAHAISKRWCHFVGRAHLLLHANFHRPPALLTTTFRLKRDKLIRYPSHPFWTAILFFLMALMRVIRKFEVSKLFLIQAWYPLYFFYSTCHMVKMSVILI